MIHHPQKEMLEKYTKGELLPSLATMISAHLEVCQMCHSHYKKMMTSDAMVFEAGSVDFPSQSVDQAFDLVMNKIKSSGHTYAGDSISENITINVSGHIIHLPRSLNFLKNRPIAWKEFGKKNAIAPIVTGTEGNFYLIYIGPGERVPKHNHTGMEYSYVVAGSYDDGISTFSTGDLSLSTHETTHSPRAISENGCLVISWVEGRLNYFDGWLKPLNSILWWYLHRA